ncbi:putative camp-dependent protein kinase regulatory chain [Fasciola gigantica]|uniref:Putative camp-dependent protein kinase regulatory chain n=1 Tax=Fasciola gigantica TaxID=46835 RepID=A0A504Z0U3_FASGI|nr:putative camp-dependent protein kinase regulatory chain [Fasciola gigantica]
MARSTALLNSVFGYFSKPVEQRTNDDVEHIFPWFVEKSQFFSSLKPDVVKDLIRNCEFIERESDDIIIRQFETGDCFYIVFSGQVAIYVNTEAVPDDVADENEATTSPSIGTTENVDNAEAKHQTPVPIRKATNRTKFGNHVGILKDGASFGELALINRDCIRNASIIADTRTQLIVINRATFNRSLREVHLASFRERSEFVNNCPLFAGWLRSLKKQVVMSLTKLSVPFGHCVIRQGEPLDGLFFLTKGQVEINVDILMQNRQFPNLMPKLSVSDFERILSKEGIKVAADPTAPLAVLKETEMLRERVGQKPISRLGYLISERRQVLKNMHLSITGVGAIFGELEYGLGLTTNATSIVCVEASEFYALSATNFERLLHSRRNTNALRMLRTRAEQSIMQRLSRTPDRRVPLFQYFFEQIYDRKMKDESEQRERVMERLTEKNKSPTTINFIPRRGPVIDEYGPGTVFYRNKQRREEAKRRQLLQRQLTGRSPSTRRRKQNRSTESNDLFFQAIPQSARTTLPSNPSRPHTSGTARTVGCGSAKYGERGEYNNTSESIAADAAALGYRGLSDWETGGDYLKHLEEKLRRWYIELEVENNWNFPVANMISPLKRYKSATSLRNLLPGKIIYIHPSARGSARDISALSPRTNLTGSETARTVRFSLVGASMEAKVSTTHSPVSSFTEALEPVEDSRASTAFEIDSSRSKLASDQRPQSANKKNKDDVFVQLTCEINDLFRAVRPISCRTGYENQLSPDLGISALDGIDCGTTGYLDSARRLRNITCGKSNKKTVNRRSQYTVSEYRDLRRTLREEEVRLKRLRSALCVF